MADPHRDPTSQALVFPPTDSEVELLAQEVRNLKAVVGDLLEYLKTLPKPAGKNLDLDLLQKRLS